MRGFSISAVILLLSFIYPPSSPAEVYKWIDENGTSHYSDQPRKTPRHEKPMDSPSPKASQKTNQHPKVKPVGFGEAKKQVIPPTRIINRCEDLSEKIDRCDRENCGTPHPFLEGFIVEHTIAGLLGGKCRYQQTMANNQLMACKFSPWQRKQYAELIADMNSGKLVESAVSAEVKNPIQTDSLGETQSTSKDIDQPTIYQVDDRETQNFIKEAIERGNCVIRNR